MPHRPPSRGRSHANIGHIDIDLLIRMPSSEMWAVEIKYGVAPKLGKHFGRTCADVGASRKYVVYGGDDEFPVGDEITVISLPRFMKRLENN